MPSLSLAQTAPATNAPPIRSPLDGNMVNLATGGLEVSATQLVIGSSGASGLSHVRYWEGNGWRHGFFVVLSTPSSGNSATVSVGDSSTTFTLSGGTYTADQANGGTLVSNANGYTYTASDGTVITFDNSNSGVYYSGSVAGLAASAIALPSGERIALVYGSYSVSTGLGGSIKFIRLQSVTSTTGYQLKFSYPATNSVLVSQVTAINNAVDYCNPAADSCSLSQSWPSVSYATTTSGSNTLESVTDSLGRVTRYTTIASSNQLIGIKRPGSSADDETIAYDSNGRVSSVTKDGMTWGYAWSLSGTTLTATVTDPLSHTRVTTADTNTLFLLTDRDENGSTTTYTPDAYGRVQTVKTPLGRSTVYSYDGRGNVTKVQTVAVGSAVSSCGSTSNATCLVSSATYPTSFTSATTYNKPTSTTDADGNTTSYGYDLTTGFVTSVTAPTGGGVTLKASYGYSPLYAYYKNSSGSIVAAAAPIYELTSKSACRPSASCSGSASEVDTINSYGPQVSGTASNLLPVSQKTKAGDNALSATTSALFDMFGNRVSATDANSQTSLYRYDADRELIGTNGPDPDGSGPLKSRAVAMHYLADGIADTVTQGTSNADGSGFAGLQTLTTGYDSADRKVRETLSAGGTSYALTQYSYDGAGRPLCVAQRMDPTKFTSEPTDACALPTGTGGSYGPDRITHRIIEYAGLTGVVQTAYGVTTANGFPKTLQRDEISYIHTLDGQVATIKDANGNLTTYGYDGFDRLIKTQYPNPSGGGSSSTDYEQLTPDANGNIVSRRLRDGTTIGYGYDALDRLTSKTLPSPEASVSYAYDNLGNPTTITQGATSLGYTFDALGRMTKETQAYGSVAYQYDLAGNHTRLTWQDGQYVTYDHDTIGEVTAIKENGSTSLASYGYDDLGRRTSRSYGNGTSTSYGYDAVSRLTSLGLAGGTNTTTVTFPDYSPAGEIKSRTNTNDAFAWTQGYNVNNRGYTADGLNRYTNVGGNAVGYDARGNLSSSGGTTYAYTAENMLKTVSSGATLLYDPLDRLQEYDTSAVTRFVYDGGMMSEEMSSAGAVLRRYVPGPGTDEPIVWYEGSGTTDKRWLDSDERGSITRITNGSGTTIAIDSYDEYGIPSSANFGRFGYTGQAWLPEIGLAYYKARIYSPTLGRFMQTDPDGYKHGGNIYRYANLNPVAYLDHTGRQAVPGALVGVGLELINEANAGNLCFCASSAIRLGAAGAIGAFGGELFEASTYGVSSIAGRSSAGLAISGLGGVAQTYSDDQILGTNSSSATYAANAMLSALGGSSASLFTDTLLGGSDSVLATVESVYISNSDGVTTVPASTQALQDANLSGTLVGALVQVTTYQTITGSRIPQESSQYFNVSLISANNDDNIEIPDLYGDDSGGDFLDDYIDDGGGGGGGGGGGFSDDPVELKQN